MERQPLSIINRQWKLIESMIATCSGDEDEDDYARSNGFGSDRFGVVGEEEEGEQKWKVLIYDEVGRDILATLAKVSDLRKLGVTLHLMLNATRQNIPDVPAVYFCSPTKGNVQRIADDCSRGLYDSYYLNFTSSIARDQLETLAEKLSAQSDGLTSQIRRIYDVYSNFVSLEDDLFTLGFDNSYAVLNDRKLKDEEVEDNVDRIVSGLFGAIATLGQVPVIRAQKGGPAEMVAMRLDARLREALTVRNNVFSDSAGSARYGAAAQSLVLIVLDRNIDLPVMLHHTWSYQALSHDLLQLKLNRVTIDVKEGSATFASGQRTFDLDKSDSFWSENAGNPFPKVAEAVETALSQYKDEVDEINRKAGGVGDATAESGTDKLAQALQSLPELTRRKQMIDLHTNIATALLDKIKDRSLDAFFQAEDQLISRSTMDKDTVMSLLNSSNGTPDDKMRLFVIYALCSGADADLDQYEATLRRAGCDLRAVKYVKEIRAFAGQLDLQSTLSRKLPPREQTMSTDIGKMMSSLVEHGSKGLTQVANNFNKLILDEDKQMQTARVVEALMDWKSGREAITEAYLYLDPRQPKNSVTKNRKPCREAVLFMVGGGNYVEYQNIKDQVKGGKNVIYGCTDLVNGDGFLRQMETLSGEPKPAVDKPNT